MNYAILHTLFYNTTYKLKHCTNFSIYKKFITKSSIELALSDVSCYKFTYNSLSDNQQFQNKKK